jgi:methionyl-tRNA formyltransferase
VLDHGCELGVVVAYGHLIRPNVLDHLPLVNVHFSLLPRWRGAAPVERAILAGDAETGVCLMRLEAGLDTGPVFVRSSTTIDPNEHADALRSRLAVIGNQLVLAELDRGDAAWSAPETQQGEPTYAEKIDVEDLHLNFFSSAVMNHRKVRVGRAWTTFRGHRLLVHEARLVDADQLRGRVEGDFPPGEIVGDLVMTTDGALELIVVQAEGKARIDMAAWRIGARPTPGERLGQ